MIYQIPPFTKSLWFLFTQTTIFKARVGRQW